MDMVDLLLDRAMVTVREKAKARAEENRLKELKKQKYLKRIKNRK